MPVYTKCNMTRMQHVLTYIVSGALLSTAVYLFYHIVILSVIVGFAGAVAVEKMYADKTIDKRQRELRLQFKEFLESMSVAVGAGNVEVQAIKSALKDLRID